MVWLRNLRNPNLTPAKSYKTDFLNKPVRLKTKSEERVPKDKISQIYGIGITEDTPGFQTVELEAWLPMWYHGPLRPLGLWLTSWKVIHDIMRTRMCGLKIPDTSFPTD